MGTLAALTTPFRGPQLSPKPGELVVDLFAALKFLKFNVIPGPGHRICFRPTGPGLFAVEIRPCFRLSFVAAPGTRPPHLWGAHPL